MPTLTVYALIHDRSKRCYVGSTEQSLTRRITEHKYYFRQWIKNSEEEWRSLRKYYSSFELLKEPAAELEWTTLATLETSDNRDKDEGEGMKTMQDRGFTLVNQRRAHGLTSVGGGLNHNDTEYRASKNALKTRLYHTDLVFRANKLAYEKARYARLSADPAWRERHRARTRAASQAYRARKRADRPPAPESSPENCAESRVRRRRRS